MTIQSTALEPVPQQVTHRPGVVRERDQTSREVARRQNPVLVPKAARAATRIHHGDNRGKSLTVSPKTPQEREVASATPDGNHTLPESVRHLQPPIGPKTG